MESTPAGTTLPNTGQTDNTTVNGPLSDEQWASLYATVDVSKARTNQYGTIHQTTFGDVARDITGGVAFGAYNGIASMANFATLGFANIDDNVRPLGGYRTFAGEIASVVGSIGVSLPVAKLAVVRGVAALSRWSSLTKTQAALPAINAANAAGQSLNTASYAGAAAASQVATRSAWAAQKLSTPILRGAAIGAVTETIGFSSEQQGLSNLLIQFNSPLLNNLVTQALAKDEDDAFFTGRFKNLLEGVIAGAAVDGILLSISKIRSASKAAKAAPTKSPSGTTNADTVAVDAATSESDIALRDGLLARPPENELAAVADEIETILSEGGETLTIPKSKAKKLKEAAALSGVNLTTTPAVDDLAHTADEIGGEIDRGGKLHVQTPKEDLTDASDGVNQEAAAVPDWVTTSKPAYKLAKVVFEDPVDKAVYMATGRGVSPTRPKTIKWLKEEYGLSDEDIKKAGQGIRDEIKASGVGAKGTTYTVRAVTDKAPSTVASPIRLNDDSLMVRIADRAAPTSEEFDAISPAHAAFNRDFLFPLGLAEADTDLLRYLWAASDLSFGPIKGELDDTLGNVFGSSTRNYGAVYDRGRMRALFRRGRAESITIVHELFHHALHSAPKNLQKEALAIWKDLNDSGEARQWILKRLQQGGQDVSDDAVRYYSEDPQEFFVEYASHHVLTKRLDKTQDRLSQWMWNIKTWILGSLGKFPSNAAANPRTQAMLTRMGELSEIIGGFQPTTKKMGKRDLVGAGIFTDAPPNSIILGPNKKVSILGALRSKPDLDWDMVTENVKSISGDPRALEALQKGDWDYFNYMRNDTGSEEANKLIGAVQKSLAGTKTAVPDAQQSAAGRSFVDLYGPEGTIKATEGLVTALRNGPNSPAVRQAFSDLVFRTTNLLAEFNRALSSGSAKTIEASQHLATIAIGDVIDGFIVRAEYSAEIARALRGMGVDLGGRSLSSVAEPIKREADTLAEVLKRLTPVEAPLPGAAVASPEVVTEASETITRVVEAAVAAPALGGALEAALKAIDGLELSIDVQSEIAKQINERVTSLMAEIARLTKAQDVGVGVAKEKGLSVVQDAMKVLPPEAAVVLAQIMKSTDRPPADVIREMAALISAAKDNPKVIADLLESVIRKEPAGWFDKYVEFWQNAILSGPRTLVTNVVNNMVQTIAAPLEVAAGGGMSDAIALTSSLFKTFHDIIHAGPSSERYMSVMGAVKGAWANEAPILDSSLGGLNESLLPAINGRLGRTIRLPWRILGATDEFFKQVNYRAYAHYEGVKEAAELVAGGSLDPSLAGKYAEDYVGNALTKSGRAARNEDGDLIAKRAFDFAERITHTTALDDVDDWVASIGRGATAMRDKVPVLRLVLPFIRTPTNILRKTISMTPGLNMTMKSYRERLMSNNSLTKAQARGEMVIGSSIMGMGVLLAGSGMITGSGPSDLKERARLRETGWRPYSVRVSDGEGGFMYIEYLKLDPYSTIFGMVADGVDVYNRAEAMGNEPLKARATHVLNGLWFSVSRNVTNKTYLTGLKEVLDAFGASDGQRASSLLNSRVASHIPAALAATPVTDDIVEVRSMLDALLSRLPGGSAGALPFRDLYGDTISVPGMSKMSPLGFGFSKPSVGEQEVATMGFGFNKPSEKWQGVDLPSVFNAEGRQAYDRFLELHGEARAGGKNMKTAIDDLVSSPGYQALPAPTGVNDFENPRIQAVSRVIAAYRKVAFANTLKEFPELAEERQRLMSAARAMPTKRTREQIANPQEALGLLR